MHGSESGPVVRLRDDCLFRLFWRRQDAFRETPIFEVAPLFRADRGAPATMTISSVAGSCMTSPGVISGRAVSERDTIRWPSQGERRWPA